MNSLVTKDQGSGIFERVLYGVAMALCMKFVSWGWLDADSAPYFAAGAVAAVGSAWAFYVNRPKSLQQAATNTGAVVITTKELADSSPNNPNIVSNITEARKALDDKA